MGPDEGHESAEVFRSRDYLLLQDDEGYSIWSLTRDSDDPVAEFEAGDDGAERAWERLEALGRRARNIRRRGALVWAAAIVGALWIASSVVIAAIEIGVALGLDRSALNTSRFSVLSIAQLALFPAFFVVVGLYVVLWMRDRDVGR